jgi:hypothetical protein
LGGAQHAQGVFVEGGGDVAQEAALQIGGAAPGIEQLDLSSGCR